MAIRLGNNKFEEGEKPLLSEDFNDTFQKLDDSKETNLPVGCVQSWLKNLANTPALPDNWVECNGQVLNDSDSPYDGQTIPDLNGDNRFLRGNSTSGGTGGEATHTLTVAEMPSHRHNVEITRRNFDSGGANGANIDDSTNTSSVGGGQAHNNEPQYYNIVWIIKVK